MVDRSAAPSANPAYYNSLAGVFRLVLEKFLQKTDDMLPAKVIAYDRASNRATVLPLIYMVTTSNERINRAQVASVPVLQLGGGGFVLSFPIQAGDLGWIKATDRDISLFKQSYENSGPNTQRKHTFEDSMFIPDVMMRGVAISDEGAVTLQNLAGTVKVALNEDSVTISSPTTITIEAGEQVIIDTPLLTCTGESNVGGIDFSTHVHTGVDAGPDESGGPSSP